jgi:Spy/CpxP family protein refolding chaperone
MKTKVLVGILLFLIVINLSTIGVFVYHLLKPPPPELEPVAGNGVPPAGMMGADMPMMRLNPEAREQMHKLMVAFREEIQSYQEQIIALEDSTVALLKNDPPPMSRVNEHLKQLADLRLLINEKAVHNLLQAKKFLAPEEQEMFFRAIMQARPQGMRMGAGMTRSPMRGRGMRGMQGHYDSSITH